MSHAPDPGFIDKVKRILGFTTKDVRERSAEAKRRLDEEIELTSVCVRNVTDEIPEREVRRIMELVPPDGPASEVDSGDKENNR